MSRIVPAILLLFLTCPNFCQVLNSHLVSGEYPSRQEKMYYALDSYQEFKPEDVSAIKKIKYDHIVLIESDTKNPFISIDERGKYSNYYRSLLRPCFEIDPYEKQPQCMDSVRNFIKKKYKTGDISYQAILRYDSLGVRKIIFYKDSQLTSGEFWLAISVDNGNSWSNYFTGLVERDFYYIKPDAKIDFIKNDSTIQLEISIVRSLNDRGDNCELIEDNLVMEMNLLKLVLDSDQDGLTDLLEKRLFTNPFSKDTDSDGIEDAIDSNPRFKSVKSIYSNLYKFLLEPYGEKDVNLISFEYPKLKKSAKSDKWTTFIVTDDVNMLNLAETRGTYIILTSKELTYYKKQNPGLPNQFYISPMFEIDNLPGAKKINFDGWHWSCSYLIIKKKAGWLVTRFDTGVD